MELLAKLEEVINQFLWTLLGLMERFTPRPVLKFISFLKRKKKHALIWIKISPAVFKRHKNQKAHELKTVMARVDVKKGIQQCETKVKKISKTSTFKKALSTFIESLKRPFKDLSAEQSVLLVAFSIGSVIAGLAISAQLQRIFLQETNVHRNPASAEVFEYERPNYYQKPLKSVQIYGVRIPVYFPETNELQTVTIDFNIVLTNKIGRIFIERREFPLRDHLIHSLEPILAQYALDSEGKDIIKDKVAIEVQNFLDQHHIESKVTSIELSYVLAN